MRYVSIVLVSLFAVNGFASASEVRCGSNALVEANNHCKQFNPGSIVFDYCLGGVAEAAQAYAQDPEKAVAVANKNCERSIYVYPQYCKSGAVAYLDLVGKIK